MIVFTALILGFLICRCILNKINTSSEVYGLINMLTYLFGLGLLATLMMLIFSHLIYAPTTLKYYGETKESVEYMRQNKISEFERAEINGKVVELNEYIAKSKLYNDTVLDIFIPDKVAELEAIE